MQDLHLIFCWRNTLFNLKIVFRLREGSSSSSRKDWSRQRDKDDSVSRDNKHHESRQKRKPFDSAEHTKSICENVCVTFCGSKGFLVVEMTWFSFSQSQSLPTLRRNAFLPPNMFQTLFKKRLFPLEIRWFFQSRNLMKCSKWQIPVVSNK